MSATYCFISPFPYQKTISLLENAIAKVGRINNIDTRRGYVLAKYKVSVVRYVKMEFFIERNDTSCNVRTIFHEEIILSVKDKWWDSFLSVLFELCPGIDFGVSLAEKSPYVVGLLYLGDDTEQIYVSHTKQNPSIAGFLIGGALFGSAGAIVGGLSGRQRTDGYNFTRFADSQLARIIYNNGRLWEGKIKKNSELYSEIMVNFQNNL